MFIRLATGLTFFTFVALFTSLDFRGKVYYRFDRLINVKNNRNFFPRFLF